MLKKFPLYVKKVSVCMETFLTYNRETKKLVIRWYISLIR